MGMLAIGPMLGWTRRRPLLALLLAPTLFALSAYGAQHMPRRGHANALKGVALAGLTTTVLPIASAGATFQPVITSGKFQGIISAHTPNGSRKVMCVPLALTGIVCP